MWLDSIFQIYLDGDATMKSRKRSRLKNSIAFQNVFARLIQDALSRYNFEGLPDTVSERVLKQSLLWYGSAVFFKKENSILCLPGVPSGKGFNLYGDPGSAWIFGYNGKLNEEIDLYLPGSDESTFLKETTTGQAGRYKGVFVRENALCFPFVNLAFYFSDLISDTYRTLDVCRKGIKSPYIITCQESMVNSVKDFFKRRDENEELILSSGVFPADKISLLPIETTSEALSDTTALIDWYEHRWRQLCGIKASENMDKKGENLIQSEVSIGDDYTALSLEKVVPYIQYGLDQVNDIFGTAITVKPRKQEEQEEKEGRENDGKDVSAVRG